MTEGDQLPALVRCPYCWAPAYLSGAFSVLVETPAGLLAVAASHVRYTCRTCGAVSVSKPGPRRRLYLRRFTVPRRHH